MAKIVLITSRLPYPNNDGRKNILNQYIHDFKDIDPDCEIINLSFIDNEEYLNCKPNYINKLICLEYPNVLEKLFNVIIFTFLLRKWPLQVSAFYSRKTRAFIEKSINKIQPDYIFFDMIRVAEYVPDKGTFKTIMNYDDLLSKRYERQIKWTRYTPSLGYFKRKIPLFIYKLMESTLVKRTLLFIESKLTRKYELTISKRFDHLVFTSPKEADEFQILSKHSSCCGIPMKFDVKEEGGQLRNYKNNKIVFTGKMNVPHNTSAVLFFCREIWPYLQLEFPILQFYIVGSSPSEEIIALQDKYPNVFVTGEVDNIQEAIEDAAVLIAPLLFGTGIKTKIIEAMSLGVPVVTNEIGMEGINAEDKVDYYLYNSKEELLNAIVKLVKDANENSRLSNNSKKFVKVNFNEQSIRSKWRKILCIDPASCEINS